MNPLEKFRAASGLVLGLAFSSTLLAQDKIRETQDALAEWIKVEKQISADKSEWVAQKEVLQNSIEFMKDELGRLEETIASSRETASAGERKRAELEEEKAKLDAVMEDMRGSVLQYETAILKQSKTWPEAFLKQIETPLKRIPSEEQRDSAPLTMRLQNIVIVLSQFDKFQNMITKDIGIQEVDGASREVITLYYGFAHAYFVDGSGKYSGYGYPKSDKWEWITDASLASKVQDLVAVYERSVDASFVGLPAKIATR